MPRPGGLANTLKRAQGQSSQRQAGLANTLERALATIESVPPPLAEATYTVASLRRPDAPAEARPEPRRTRLVCEGRPAVQAGGRDRRPARDSALLQHYPKPSFEPSR